MCPPMPPGSSASRPQFTALRSFAVDGTDHASHAEQASMIRRYIAWRNRSARDRRLGQIVNRAWTTVLLGGCWPEELFSGPGVSMRDASTA